MAFIVESNEERGCLFCKKCGNSTFRTTDGLCDLCNRSSKLKVSDTLTDDDARQMFQVPKQTYCNSCGTPTKQTKETPWTDYCERCRKEFDALEIPETAVKHDDEKNPLALLPTEALEGVGLVLLHGAKKYGANNWRAGMDWTRLISAALRHVFAFVRGEDIDPESGLPHLDHALCCLLFLSSYQKTSCGRDDRYTSPSTPTAYYNSTPVEPCRPKIVCLCGSTRFGAAFKKAMLSETLAGKIVLSVGCHDASDEQLGIGQESSIKERLDELHLRKIDLADEILVLNVNGYIGKSTSAEINYAKMKDKLVRYLE